jgi:hypothetical protein
MNDNAKGLHVMNNQKVILYQLWITIRFNYLTSCREQPESDPLPNMDQHSFQLE